MANYICIDSVEEQVNYLIDKINDLKTNKLDKTAVVQETGTGTDVVMSQKAVTDAIENKGLDTLTDVNLTLGNTTVQYDTTNGIQINSTARFTDTAGNHDATMDLAIPVVGTDGIVIDKAADSEKIQISGSEFLKKSQTPYIVYSTDENGYQIVRSIASGSSPSSIAQYTGYGTLRTGTPTSDSDCATKKYVDDGFVKKQTGVSDKLYYIDSAGQDGILGFSQYPFNSAITQYTSSGTVRTNTPTYELDAANKKYVDDKITELVKLYQHNYTFEAGTNNYVYCTTYKNSNTPMTKAEVINFFKSDPSVGKVVNVCVVDDGTTVGSGYFFDAGEGIDYTVIVLNSSANFIINADTNMTTNIIEL